MKRPKQKDLEMCTIAKYNEVTLEHDRTIPKQFVFDWNVYAQDGTTVAYCGQVQAPTEEIAKLRAWLQIEGSEWYTLGLGRVWEAGEWVLDWDCKQSTHLGHGGF